MANAVWGKVYYQDTFVGILERDPGGRHIFTYDTSYVNSVNPAIAFSLPKQHESFISESGLHPFFDNLVAEGWLQEAQAKALKVSPMDHLALLLGFGYDLPGAVSIIDPERSEPNVINHFDNITKAALKSHASLSGVQHKLLLIKEGEIYRPVIGNELSTHIAKLPSTSHPGIIELEFLTTLAIRSLLPNDTVVNLAINSISTLEKDVKEALIVQRFDRTHAGSRIHFEEFNQLLGYASGDSKYNGSYGDMGRFVLNTPNCKPLEADVLFNRVITSLLVGNTDAHLKNFALFHSSKGMHLTPSYDLVAAARYKEYNTIALQVGKTKNLKLGSLTPKHLIDMGREFGLSEEAVFVAIEEIGKKLKSTIAILEDCNQVKPLIKEKVIGLMEKRWNGSFNLIGQFLSKRQNKDASL